MRSQSSRLDTTKNGNDVNRHLAVDVLEECFEFVTRDELRVIGTLSAFQAFRAFHRGG